MARALAAPGTKMGFDGNFVPYIRELALASIL